MSKSPQTSIGPSESEKRVTEALLRAHQGRSALPTMEEQLDYKIGGKVKANLLDAMAACYQEFETIYRVSQNPVVRNAALKGSAISLSALRATGKKVT